MSAKEATARIKINRLLEAAGWRFFDDNNRAAIKTLHEQFQHNTA